MKTLESLGKLTIYCNIQSDFITTSTVTGFDYILSIVRSVAHLDDKLQSVIFFVELNTILAILKTLFVDEPCLGRCRLSSHLSIILDHRSSMDLDVIQVRSINYWGL